MQIGLASGNSIYQYLFPITEKFDFFRFVISLL